MARKRKLPPHIVLPNGQWRFVKSGAKKKSFGVSSIRRKTIKKRRYNVMARRKKSYRRGGGGLGSLTSLIAPIAAGAADSYINPMLPINGVGSVAIGMFMHNTTIKDIGLWQVGASLPSMFGIGQGSKGVWL